MIVSSGILEVATTELIEKGLCLLNPMKKWLSSKWNLSFQVQN
jgi:hypothetical protein